MTGFAKTLTCTQNLRAILGHYLVIVSFSSNFSNARRRNYHYSIILLYCIKQGIFMFFSENKVLLVYLCYYSNITTSICRSFDLCNDLQWFHKCTKGWRRHNFHYLPQDDTNKLSSKLVSNCTLGSSWFRNLSFSSVSKSMKTLALIS